MTKQITCNIVHFTPVLFIKFAVITIKNFLTDSCLTKHTSTYTRYIHITYLSHSTSTNAAGWSKM